MTKANEFNEASLDRLTEEQMHDIWTKTAKDHPKTFHLLVKSLLKSAVRSAARTKR